mmetsp:Transcript_3435/g.8835  ORF Transcript_3435/g.8835 Transcript_3435/m.8835 type:complete len:208 (+) Transcript_3435:1208-1831(+)
MGRRPQGLPPSPPRLAAPPRLGQHPAPPGGVQACHEAHRTHVSQTVFRVAPHVGVGGGPVPGSLRRLRTDLLCQQHHRRCLGQHPCDRPDPGRAKARSEHGVDARRAGGDCDGERGEHLRRGCELRLCARKVERRHKGRHRVSWHVDGRPQVCDEQRESHLQRPGRGARRADQPVCNGRAQWVPTRRDHQRGGLVRSPHQHQCRLCL